MIVFSILSSYCLHCVGICNDQTLHNYFAWLHMCCVRIKTLQPYSYHQFSELSEKKFRKVLSKNFRMIFWKLHILANIGLRSMFYTSSESENNMQRTDDVIFEIFFQKIGEIKFPKNHSYIFWQNLPRFLSGKFRKMVIGIVLLKN